jgi:tetratricopeptide (TPR) repeat protein
MEPERWREIERVYQLAREQAPGRRAAFLEQTCGRDEELRLEVESLLSHADGAEEYFEAAVLEVAAHARDLPGVAVGTTGRTVPQGPGETAGTAIGRYRLLRKIGEGGMGEVWLAEQEEPVRRRVALKLVKAGMNTREVIARFESERQALALMDHPAIAKVFDAGSRPRGGPYFVMEYVAGIPITDYCDNNRLSIRQRLELFIQVCEGVHHAHQKAIIHRDLKPSNILVVEVDGRAAPKIIDFGVAKALTQKLTEDTMFTRAGALVGTPVYMSPEQANWTSEDIDTRTDVYSLGVILYEVLAGVPPLEMRKIAFVELLRRLREEEPAKPSARIRALDRDAAVELAHERQTVPLALSKQIRGDLDLIALKALDKDRSRRYGSPSDLAADIRRYLKDEAVLAAPPTAVYRARKFARRYRGGLAVAIAFVLVLILAAGVSIWQSVRATRQRDRADTEAAVAQAVNDFLQNDLLAQASANKQAGPAAKPDPDLKVRTALDRAALRIAGRFDRQPEVEAAIRDTIGQAYTDLGLYPDARTQLERAVDVERRMFGAENPKTLKTISRLGRIAFLQGQYPQAEKLLRQTLEIQRRTLGSEHRDTLYSLNNLANVYYGQSKSALAEGLYLQILEIQRRLLGSEHLDSLKSMNNLGLVYFQQGKYPQAEAIDSQTLEIRRRVLGPEHPETLGTMNNLGNVFFQQGKYAQAEALHSQTLEMRRRVLGPEHAATLSSMNNLANVYTSQYKYAQAARLYSQTLDLRRRILGREHQNTLASMDNLADMYCRLGRYDRAETLFTQALASQRAVLGPEHPDTLTSMHDLALVYQGQGKYAPAESLYGQTLEIQRRVRGPEHPDTLSTLSDSASMYQREGKYALAESYAAQALAGQRRTLGLEHPDTMDTASALALSYQSQGKFAESESLAREVLQFNRKRRPDDWHGFFAESLLGASLAGQKKYPEGEALLLEGYQGMVARKDRIGVPDWYHLDRAREWTVRLYQAWGKQEKAAEWSKK